MPTGQDLIAMGQRYLGLPYLENVNWKPGAQPTGFDCSEFTRWVTSIAGAAVALRDGSVDQFLQCRQAVRVISVADAVRTPGALLFAFRDANQAPLDPSVRWPSHKHVAFSMGDSAKTLEAYGADGIGVAIKGLRLSVDAAGNVVPRFNYGGLVPGVDYRGFTGQLGTGASGGGVAPAPPPAPGGSTPGAFRPRNDKRVLSQGTTGEDVREAQSMLIAVGAPSLAGRSPTPNFGPLTVDAVAWFQQKVLNEQGSSTGMRITRQVGPVTWGWLYAYTGR